MAISLSPVGLSAAPVANELHVLAAIKERFCREYCINADLLPQAFVSYKVGTSRFQNTTVFIPVDATVTVVLPNCCCNNALPKLYHERFVIAFANQTGVPTAVNLTQNGSDVQPAFFNQCNCNKANGIAINEELLITITPAAAPAATAPATPTT